MRSELTKSAILAVLVTGLAACAGGSARYPSLAMRPFESEAATASPAPGPAPIRTVIAPARVTAVRAEAAAAHSAFLAAAADAERLARAGAGQPIESNARGAAIIALAELDVQRGKTAGALAAMDALAAEAAGALSPDPAITAAQTDLAATLAEEDMAIARIWKVMGS